MEVQKARRRPLVFDFVELADGNGPEAAQWCGGEWVEEAGAVLVPTVHGQIPAEVSAGLRIMKGTLDFYPVHKRAFADTYEDLAPGMRLRPLESGRGHAAVCDCGESCPGISIRDAVVRWALHAVEKHRDEL